jgi:hypothetical protein
MLFDAPALRVPLPEKVLVFASGANRVAEILGFARVGIPVGVSVCELNDQALSTLIETGNPVLIDSGAFSEVDFSDAGPRIASMITDLEWRRRLSVYLRLARGLHEKALLVAPDRVGDQRVTLDHLARYRMELAEIAATGAELLIALQVGVLSHTEFYRAAMDAAAVALLPALPLKKAATSAAEIAEFVAAVQPPKLHLLGMGVENDRSKKLIRLIRLYSPNTRISMDSNRIRAVTGKGRRMTSTEARLRTEEAESVYGGVWSESLALIGVILDYTDEIARPSRWATATQLSAIAAVAELDSTATSDLLSDPDRFLQSPIRANEGLTWIEHPVVSFALDRAWEEFVYETVRTSVRRASIVHTFESSIISGQLPT